MARNDRRKSKTKKIDYSQRMNRLKAKALTHVAKQAWSQELRYKSIPLLTEALRRDPANTDILISLATACGKQRHYEKAEELLGRLLALKPRNASIYRRVAQTYVVIERLERAVECYHRSLELNRDACATVPTLLELAQMYERFHKLDEARAIVEEALRLDPGNADGQLQQAILNRRHGATGQAESGLRSLVTSGAGKSHIYILAWYELAQLLDDQERYDEAYQAFVAAKQLIAPQASSFREQNQATLRRNEQLLASLDETCYASWSELSQKDTPYRFAVLTSHPRSGTTLVEQVLDGHDELKSADEFDVFSQWVHAPLFRRFRPGTPVLTVLEHVPPAVRQEARATYWRQTEAIFDEPISNRMLLDKNPGMTILLPIINWAFPEMKMLIALRDPRDVVLSCFMQKVPLTPISSNWLNLADAAEYYSRSMQTWLAVRRLSSSPWLEFRYEDVVADLERESRKILEFLGLPWDEKVLKFYEHAREKIVRSPTYKDVTQPVYHKSVGRWRHYAKHFEPVQEKLAPYVKEFGYDVAGTLRVP
jgi:tetratricopeptide (TPR) repeat protein